MPLQKVIQGDLTRAILNRNPLAIGTLKIVISELQREPQKDVPDDRVMKILKKMAKDERTLSEPDQGYIDILESYLPKEATDEEIRSWITSNIDFTQFKNKMQAMRPVMINFEGRADGNRVKAILDSL
jgi:uncharacterized protein